MNPMLARPLLPMSLLALCTALLAPGRPAAQEDKQDFSPAERLLFMSNQLGGVDVPATLKYSFHKSGSLEESFRDSVSITLAKQADGSCCRVQGDFLTGARRLAMPEVENAQANPVTMYFLEHDVRDMQRLTKGQPNHFRKRIRMAIYNESKVEDVTVNYRGRTVAAKEIRISPYENDSSRQRFEKFAHKDYVFTVSAEVPGGVVAIRSLMAAPTPGQPALIAEELLIDGAGPLHRH